MSMHLRNFAGCLLLVSPFLGGCQNGSGSGGVTPADATGQVSAAQVSLTNPIPGAKGVPVQASVQATFSQQIDPASVTPATFTLFHGGNQVAGSVSSDGFSITFTPTQALLSTAPYKATVTKSVRDAQGKPLAEEYSWIFTTGDVLAPVILVTDPLSNATGVPVTTIISASFSEDLDASTVNASSFSLVGPLGPVPGTVSYGAKAVFFTPNAALEPPSQPLGPGSYTASISGSVADLSGNPLGVNYSWSFVTVDQTPPQVVGISPADGASGIVFTENPFVIFNEEMSLASLNSKTLILLDSNNLPVVGNVAYDASQNKATFDPSVSLKANATYTFSVITGPSGVKDLAGNPLDPACTLCSATFSTISGWAPPTNIESLDFDAINPQFMVAPPGAPFPLGTMFAIWQQRNSTTNPVVYDIYAAMYDPVTSAWTAPTILESAAGDAANPQFASDPSGTIMAVFQQKNGSETFFSMFAAKFDPTAGWPAGWEDPIILEAETATSSAAINPQVAAASDGSFIAVFQQKIPGQTGVNSIVANRYDPATSSWDATTTVLEESAFESANPQIVGLDNGDFIVVFQQRTATGAAAPNNIMATRYKSGTGWPAAPVSNPIEVGASDALNPRLAVVPQGAANAGLVFAAWQQRVGSDAAPYSILSAVFDPGTENWSSEASIESDSGTSTLPYLAAGPDGSVFAIWLKLINGESVSSVVVNRFTPGFGWGANGAVLDNLSGNLVADPRITVSSNGRVMAVWAQTETIFPPYSIVANEIQIDGSWDPTAVITVESATENASKPQIVATPSNGFFSIFQQPKLGQTVNSIFVGEAP